MLKSFLLTSLIFLALTVGTGLRSADHFGGVSDTKGRSLNLTDLYVFKEGDQTGTIQDNSNLILILNTNPRSLPKQQYHFSTNARYEFHISRVTDTAKTITPSVIDDVTLRFEFTAADASTQRQSFTLTVIKDSQTHIGSATTAGGPPQTTSLVDLRSGNTNIVTNTVTLDGYNLTLFAGLRQDPFFGDLEQIFRFRGSMLGTYTGAIPDANNTAGGDPFKSAAQAVDYSKGFNVNSIVARVPIAFLKSNPNQTTFDVWASVFVPN